MDRIVQIDERAICCISLTPYRHDDRRLIELEKPRLPSVRQTRSKGFDAALYLDSRLSEQPIERKMRV